MRLNEIREGLAFSYFIFPFIIKPIPDAKRTIIPAILKKLMGLINILRFVRTRTIIASIRNAMIIMAILLGFTISTTPSISIQIITMPNQLILPKENEVMRIPENNRIRPITRRIPPIVFVIFLSMFFTSFLKIYYKIWYFATILH